MQKLNNWEVDGAMVRNVECWWVIASYKIYVQIRKAHGLWNTWIDLKLLKSWAVNPTSKDCFALLSKTELRQKTSDEPWDMEIHSL